MDARDYAVIALSDAVVLALSACFLVGCFVWVLTREYECNRTLHKDEIEQLEYKLDDWHWKHDWSEYDNERAEEVERRRRFIQGGG